MDKHWLFLLFTVFAAFQAQAQSPLKERMNLNVVNAPLESVLYNLMDRGVPLSFNNNVLPSGKLVTFQKSNATVEEILEAILETHGLAIVLVGEQIVIVKDTKTLSKKMLTISGYVNDENTGEPIVSATVFDPVRRAGTYVNEFGYFSITLNSGEVKLVVSSLGYEPDTLLFSLNSNTRLEFELKPYNLAEIVVKYFDDSTYLVSQLDAFELNLDQVSKMPSLGGEPDILRLGYTLPGIQTGADGFGGMSVRGGDIDQNLFLLDGVPIYNATHGLGLYSIFNAAAVKNAKIMKGNFPAQFGGRIASIWNINTKDGNSKEVNGDFEIGPSSAQVSLEGPWPNRKGAWFISGRRALFDFFSVPITQKLRETDDSKGYLKYYFYDFNTKLNYQITKKDKLFLSYYKGLDDFVDRKDKYRWFQDTLSVLSNDEIVNWGNQVAAVRWNHIISDKIFANITATYSRYFYRSEDLVDLELLNAEEQLLKDVFYQQYSSNVRDITLKSDFDITTFGSHQFKFGTNFTHHKIQPGIITFEELSIFNKQTRDTIGAYLKNPLVSNEYDAYVQDDWKINNILSANLGVRCSGLSVRGHNFFIFQPRMLLDLFKGQRTSFSAAIVKNAQFMHLLSPTSVGLPKDLWVSATSKAPPQQAWQFSAGMNHQINSWLDLNLEGYYKSLHNLVYFLGNGLENVNSTNWQNDIEIGKGWAYGAEFLLSFHRRKLGGWASYTYSRATRKFGTEVNNGNLYPFRLDRRHNFSLQFLYKISPKWDFSSSFTFATGSAFTLATQSFDIVQPQSGSAPTEIVKSQFFATELNGFRLPNYHRLDFLFNYSFKYKKLQQSFKIGAYNVYVRKNPAYLSIKEVFDENGNQKIQAVQTSLLPFFPTLRYGMSF